MTQKLFIETIEALQNQYEHDKKCSEAFKILLPSDHVTYYDNHFITNQLVKMIQIPMGDFHEHSLVEYYIHDLQFGKKYIEGCLKDNGKNIDISDAGKLWDYLNSKKQSNNEL